MAFISDYAYYENSGTSPASANWGSYQYVSLDDIVNNFMLVNVGEDKLIHNVKRYEVVFHAKHAIQDLNYNALKEVKAIEFIVGSDLKMILPHDYVNYVRLSLETNGVLYVMSENQQAISATAYTQDNNLDLTFDINGNVVTGQSKLDIHRLAQEVYTGAGIYSGSLGWNCDGNWYFPHTFGGRYGLDTSKANSNPTFRINRASGVIDFASNISDQVVVLEYISDGMKNGIESDINVNKLFEEYMYAYLKWALLSNKYGIQEYVVKRCSDEKARLKRNAKLALSNMHPSRLLMAMRGKDQQLK
jgi:hypothetical protein